MVTNSSERTRFPLGFAGTPLGPLDSPEAKSRRYGVRDNELLEIRAVQNPTRGGGKHSRKTMRSSLRHSFLKHIAPGDFRVSVRTRCPVLHRVSVQPERGLIEPNQRVCVRTLRRAPAGATESVPKPRGANRRRRRTPGRRFIRCVGVQNLATGEAGR